MAATNKELSDVLAKGEAQAAETEKAAAEKKARLSKPVELGEPIYSPANEYDYVYKTLSKQMPDYPGLERDIKRELQPGAERVPLPAGAPGVDRVQAYRDAFDKARSDYGVLSYQEQADRQAKEYAHKGEQRTFEYENMLAERKKKESEQKKTKTASEETVRYNQKAGTALKLKSGMASTLLSNPELANILGGV